jgi:hypothetical protein
MGNKRRNTPHQRQIRFLTILFGAIMIAVAVAVLLLVNRPPSGGVH